MEKKYGISQETIKRMIRYLRYLEIQKEKGVKIISSKDVTSFLNVPPAQFRKDLSFFGGFGKRGVGYDVHNLILKIKEILGLNKKNSAVLVGAGRLGSALIKYPGFSDINIDIVAAFENDEKKIGQSLKNVKIYSIDGIKEFTRKSRIRVALLCVPAEAAQAVADILVDAGIKGILNFSPAALILPGDVYVGNVDMASEIGNIIYHMDRKQMQ
ncbi:MAG: redox-sensing transcriptional repressor Rex [Candidatus Omnitrophica bacterium]|nr:redox-sensing transcriptional repressor Rex [Candidatus Omnitrophota bacterium]